MPNLPMIFARMGKAARLFVLRPAERRYLRLARGSGLFDRRFYCGAHPGLHPVYRFFPLRHFILVGETMGLQPNPDFSPAAYLRLNPDVATSGQRPFLHFLTRGRGEGRRARALPAVPELPAIAVPTLRFDPGRDRARFAIVVHVYYPELWEEFARRLADLEIAYDLYVTLTWRGPETQDLAERIRSDFPNAYVACFPNRGRDILPFVSLVNAGAFDGYASVAKIHTKKSPHRPDGGRWRRHLVDGILPRSGLRARLDGFLADEDAGIWVADGQCFAGAEWWGANRTTTEALLRRVELDDETADLSFPAGSIYWVKPLVIGMIKALRLEAPLFEAEEGQVDGTLAHAFERALGGLARGAGLGIRQSGEIGAVVRDGSVKAAHPARVAPAYVSAFYLPQFHPIPENDAWWGRGYTEWRAALDATSMFPGHLQPMRPADLGYYDLRAPEVLGAQAALAREAGIDAFCVYHYWFDPRRILDAPLANLLRRPEVDFPFYLCWANESWRRNWDGLSGELLLEQRYEPGFETRLAASAARYMRDPRYQRPDGQRPRFVIYRPGEFPEPAASVERLREAWRQAGIGEVELGAVHFHVNGRSEVPAELFDFWVEMPPHGLVEGPDYVFGGAGGNRMGAAGPTSGFSGLIYDYAAVARRACSSRYAARLPPHTIAGIMPAWDNTARRGPRAHIARGANPASFRRWLRDLRHSRLSGSYRQELFVNAWNEWAEKAMLEPSETFGRLYLDVLAEVCAHRG